jgi:hypothetical protein
MLARLAHADAAHELGERLVGEAATYADPYVVAELSRRGDRAAAARALDLPVVAVDGMLDELLAAQGDDLRTRAFLADLNEGLRRVTGRETDDLEPNFTRTARLRSPTPRPTGS